MKWAETYFALSTLTIKLYISIPFYLLILDCGRTLGNSIKMTTIAFAKLSGQGEVTVS